jgi:hypothetical protein
VPRVVTDKEPENLSIYTTSGPITAEVLLIHDGSATSKRASLDLCTDDGFLHAIVVRPSPSVFRAPSVVPCFRRNDEGTLI